jgi:hypothetical protein
MPESIAWPPTHPRAHPPRRRRRFLLFVGVLAVIFFGGRTALSNYVDLLWFRKETSMLLIAFKEKLCTIRRLRSTSLLCPR